MTVAFDVDGVRLHGELVRPDAARGVVVFAHGSGSSRHSPRNRALAAWLQDAGFATLLFDLLEAAEERHRALVFDIGLLATRLEAVARRVLDDPATAGLPLGFFGASTGAAAALRAAAAMGDAVGAVVSRGGRPDLAGDALPVVRAPTLLIVGADDREVLELNRRAAYRLHCEHRIEVVPGATHLFEEPGTLEQAGAAARGWFAEHLAGDRTEVVPD